MLVDTGADTSILFELPKYMPANDRTIEVVVLTHSHDDHIQGLFALLNNYKVGMIVYASQCFKSKDFEYIKTNYKDILYDLNEEWKLAYGDISASAIYPIGLNCHQNVNEDSIVLDVKIKDTKILLMGDAGFEAEEYLLKNSLVSQVDILKAGHHCSRTATSDMFLSEIFPSIAICSVGEGNTFGHPHSETIKKFENANVQYLITYQEGNIVFTF
jgi:competence protein ComEC